MGATNANMQASDAWGCCHILAAGTWIRLPHNAGSRHAAAAAAGVGSAGRFTSSHPRLQGMVPGGAPSLLQGVSGRLLLQLQAGAAAGDEGAQMAGIEVSRQRLAGLSCISLTCISLLVLYQLDCHHKIKIVLDKEIQFTCLPGGLPEV
jgi:hypothetical protein